MGYRVIRAEELAFEERPGHEGQAPRLAADLTGAAALRESRARIWRYPPRTRGRRHRELAQEEVFVVLAGTLTILLGDPPERVDLGPGSVVSLEAGTAVQLRNESDGELTVFVYGAPAVAGQAEIIDDVPVL